MAGTYGTVALIRGSVHWLPSAGAISSMGDALVPVVPAFPRRTRVGVAARTSHGSHQSHGSYNLIRRYGIGGDRINHRPHGVSPAAYQAPRKGTTL
jgi:hypothetical protein